MGDPFHAGVRHAVFCASECGPWNPQSDESAMKPPLRAAALTLIVTLITALPPTTL